jgi:hypothetical protein
MTIIDEKTKAEVEFLRRAVTQLSCKVETLEERSNNLDRGFDNLRLSIDSLKETLNLQMTVISKDIVKFTELAEGSKLQNLTQQKDIDTFTSKLQMIEAKHDTVMRLEEKVVESEKKLTNLPKTVATVTTIIVSVAALIIEFFIKG